MAAKLFSVYLLAIAGLEVIRAAPLTLNQRNDAQCSKSQGDVSTGIAQMSEALAQLAAQMEPANCTALLSNDTAPPAVDNSTALCDPAQNATGACDAGAGDAGAKGKGKKAKGAKAAGAKAKGAKAAGKKAKGAKAAGKKGKGKNEGAGDASNSTASANATSVDCGNNATVICNGTAVNATDLSGSICNSTALVNSTCLVNSTDASNSTCLGNSTDLANSTCLVNSTCLGNSTDLANSTVVDSSCLANSTSLANSTALLDASNCTALNDTSSGAVESAQSHVKHAQDALASMGHNAKAASQVTGNLTLAMNELAGMNSTSPEVASMMNQTMTMMGNLAKAAGALAQDCASA